MPGRVLMQDLTGVPAVVDLAAMRSAMARNGGDPSKVDPLVPADLIIDHSVQVDLFRSEGAYAANIEWEYRRNAERYALLRWAQQAFDGLRVVPPGAGICHQVNLEHLGQVVTVRDGVAFPDTLVGTDSHTTMINGLGVLGWGVGGIEAEAAMLGQPAFMPQPLDDRRADDGEPPSRHHRDRPGAHAHRDASRARRRRPIRRVLRRRAVHAFHRRPSDACPTCVPSTAPPPHTSPSTTRRSAICAFTGRGDLVDVVERYTKEQGLFRSDGDPDPVFTEVLDLDLVRDRPVARRTETPAGSGGAARCLGLVRRRVPRRCRAGPEADRGRTVRIGGGNPDVAVDVDATIEPGTETPIDVNGATVRHGSVVIAAITSCTNTSNPSVMLAAGLLAKKAVEAGLETKPWVKTSLAPGSRVVTDYLDRAGLTPYLDKLGFSLVGYGCTTCIGNSGPLPENVASAVDEGDLNVVAVLSGNRNFEGRIHPQVRASYLASPPLCVAYALAGSVQIDLTTEPLGRGADGPVFLSDIWPSADDVAQAIRTSLEPQQFEHEYGRVWDGDENWAALPSPSGPMYDWDPDSTYVQEPPFFDDLDDAVAGGNIEGARVLVKVGDSITTDHISPAGSIKADSPAGEFLKARGVSPAEFNSYGARRGNHEVMMRGTFANIRLRNEMAPGTEGPWTTYLPDGDLMTVFDAAGRYREAGVPLAVLAGKEYGSGSSRDWAAKGPSLLGVRFVIAESYERIHRSNLVGMGVLPLQFAAGESAASLGLSGRETFSVRGLEGGVSPGMQVAVEAVSDDGARRAFSAIVRIDGAAEVDYFAGGGLLRMVLRELLER